MVKQELQKRFLVGFCICILVFVQVTVKASNTNFQTRSFQLCNNTQGLVKFNGNITTELGEQYITFFLMTPFAWDDNIGGVCRIESKVGNTFMELFTIREKHFCKAVHKYMGEFWYNFERAAQLPTGHCPIPAGKHHVNHMKLDYSKISLQTFPFGRLRFTLNMVDNRNPSSHLVCWLMEVDNEVN